MAVVADVVEALFSGSDGRYYTDWQVRRRTESGYWRRCLSQHDTQGPVRLLVAIDETNLVMLTRVDPETLPRGFEIRVENDRARVAHSRSAVSNGSRHRPPRPGRESEESNREPSSRGGSTGPA